MGIKNTAAGVLRVSGESFWGKDVTTPAMRKAIDEWFRLYFQREATKDEDPCQRLPVTIVGKLCKTTFAEYDAGIADEASPMNAWQAQNLDALDAVKKEALQWALAGGECLLRPMVAGGRFVFSVIRRDHYAVLGRDATGKLTGVGAAERFASGGKHYTLLEWRGLDANGYLTVAYRLYQSSELNCLGAPVALDTLPQFAGLPPRYTYPQPVGSVGLVQLRVPLVNCVDGSADAVSVYEPAVQLIHNINRNERQYDKEFENSQNRIIASSDLITKDAYGSASIPEDLIVGLDDDPKQVGMTVFNPEMRDASYDRRRQGYLRTAETIIGLKRGILSEVEAAERTAKEITSSEGDYSLTIVDFQNAWYDAAQEALRLCAQLGATHGIAPAGVWERGLLAMKWGNGILYDGDAWWNGVLEMVRSKLLKAEIALAWKYDEPWETEADLDNIRAKYMPALEEMTGGY